MTAQWVQTCWTRSYQTSSSKDHEYVSARRIGEGDQSRDKKSKREEKGHACSVKIFKTLNTRSGARSRREGGKERSREAEKQRSRAGGESRSSREQESRRNCMR